MFDRTNTQTIHTRSEFSLHLVVMMSTTHLGIQLLDSISLSKSSLMRMKLHISHNG